MTKKRQGQKAALLSALLCLGLLAGCGGPGGAESAAPTPPEQTGETPRATPTLAPTPTPEPTPVQSEPLAVSGREEVKGELLAAMEGLYQPRPMDLAGDLALSELDVKNLYYEITAERPQLRYAYDLLPTLREGRLTCEIAYMPYKTGDFPEGFAGEEVSSLPELLALAESHLGEGEIPLRITDPSLEPDRMNRALQQVGGGYILCMLNADATALVYTPPQGMTLEECVAELTEADSLAAEVVAQVTTPEMSQREQARALYAYLTANVTYDPLYESDRANMPYQSQTALGALRDHRAICGGYANALKLLYGQVGIPCYTVSGKCLQENHMWNVAQLDGEWLWFDATVDRGSSGEFGFLRFALKELDTMKYHYDEGDVRDLTAP